MRLGTLTNASTAATVAVAVGIVAAAVVDWM